VRLAYPPSISSPTGSSKAMNPHLSQEKLDQYQTKDMPVNLVLFDEIEKANDALFQLLLGILDHGKITLGNGKEVKFDQSVIIMTSNLGTGRSGRPTFR
jgi:ATP-dependent Clp protease ATP-binding subunit ClpB